MNCSAPAYKTLFCRVLLKEVTDKRYTLVSIGLLSFIGILGIAGNTLVLLVYCPSPKSIWSCFASSQQTPRLRRGLQHSQRKLLIALSVVDLLTSALVLPCDIGYKVFTFLNICIYCNTNINNIAYGLIDNVRNIMFALEGSILTAIAIDRFLVIGCPYLKNMRNKLRKRASSVSEISSSPMSSIDVSPKPGGPKIDVLDKIIATSPDATQNKLEEVLERQERRPHLPVASVSSPNRRRQLCVLLPILITSLIIIAFEAAVFILHVRQYKEGGKSLDAERLRYFLNRLYLVFTMVTFPLVCGPYICVLLAIRSYDRRRARLLSGLPSNPPRARRTARTLFIATLVFYLTLLPVLIVHFGNWSTDSGTREDLAKDVHMNPGSVYIHHEFYYINNAVNFFIYSWVSPAFRTRLKELCGRN
ncbi:unnamed protein product [Mesocestoides corti]|uniref:G-protein coupled receptors family 1 profile domain-containing protein n=2 Tax=Mesocestoides corti TaxID=53468 RepID=A0A0R3U1J8_MESCO|nr:unnamed protein product [Mesocestoides corti]